MGELSTKNLVGRCARDPWKAVMSNLPLNYQIPAIGEELAIQRPTQDNILKWRNSLDAYVPPFPATV